MVDTTSFYFPETAADQVLKAEYKSSSKTEDEIRKFTLEDNLSETSRGIIILTRGQQVQKFSVYLRMPETFSEPEAVTKLLPIILEELLNQEDDIQIQAAKSLATLLLRNVFDRLQIINVFRTTLSILKIWNKNVLDEWILVLQSIFKCISYELIDKECTNTVLLLSESSQPTVSKYTAAKMIGIIAEKTMSKFPGALIERARILCQDPDIEIRLVMARGVIGKVAQALGPELVEIYIFEKIMELVYDSDINVKISAIELVFTTLDAFSAEIQKTRITTLFTEQLGSANEEVIKKISFLSGKIFYSLSQYIQNNSSHLSSLLSHFKEYGSSKNSEIRKNFCYNLPAIVILTEPKTFDAYRSLYINALCNDKSTEVRCCAVSVLHEIIKLVGPEESQKLFFDSLTKLLKEESAEILMRVIKYLRQVVDAFSVEELRGTPQYEAFFDELFDALVDYFRSNMNHKNWRVVQALLEAFNGVADGKFFRVNDVADKYLPLLIQLMKSGNAQIRASATTNLVKVLRTNYNNKKRVEIIKTIADTFKGASSYSLRVVYVQFCLEFVEKFSRNYVRVFLLPDCISLAKDKVNIVRSKVADFFMVLRKNLLPDDEENIKKLEDALQALVSDRDSEVSKRARNSVLEISKMRLNHQDAKREADAIDKEKIKEEERQDLLEQKDLEEQKRKQLDDIDSLMSFKNSKSLKGSKLSSSPSLPKVTRPAVGKERGKTIINAGSSSLNPLLSLKPVEKASNPLLASQFTAPVKRQELTVEDSSPIKREKNKSFSSPSNLPTKFSKYGTDSLVNLKQTLTTAVTSTTVTIPARKDANFLKKDK